MAVGRGGKKCTITKTDPETTDESGYISTESDFYGDDLTIDELEKRAASFSVSRYWASHLPSIQEVAIANLVSSAPRSFNQPQNQLCNPYEGNPSAWQLSETVDEFLDRLPPATTAQTISIPWIYIANPYRKVYMSLRPESTDQSITSEAPSDEDCEWPAFLRLAGDYHVQLTNLRDEVERTHQGKAKGLITRLFNQEKDELVKKILSTAVETSCTTGKWMIFCTRGDINAVWSVVARATSKNELGIAAKVSPSSSDVSTREHIICIYTKDFTDMDDISRVVHKLRDMGIIERNGRPIYYKCDAYTYLGLKSDNQWGIQASLYKSTDILQADKKRRSDTKLDSLLYKKRKGAEDWKTVEYE